MPNQEFAPLEVKNEKMGTVGKLRSLSGQVLSDFFWFLYLCVTPKPGAWFKCRVGQWEGPGGITTGPNRVQVDSACKECFVFYLNLLSFSDSFVDLDNLPCNILVHISVSKSI